MDQKQRRGPQCSIEILGPIELQKNLKRIITQKNDQHTDLMNEPKSRNHFNHINQSPTTTPQQIINTQQRQFINQSHPPEAERIS